MKINEHHFCNFEDFVKRVATHYEQIEKENDKYHHELGETLLDILKKNYGPFPCSAEHEEESEENDELCFEINEKLDFYAKLGYLEGSIDCVIIDTQEGRHSQALSTLRRLKEYISTGF